MGWFRWGRRFGAYLALLALALQLGLTFGHVHTTLFGHSTGIAAQTAAEPDSGHGDADKDYCPSCAILSLLSGAQTSAAPVSIEPIPTVAGTASPAFETVRSGTTWTAFRSRAPPHA